MSKFVNSYLDELGTKLKDRFREGGHIFSYPEYMAQVAGNPGNHLRDAACYIKDMFDHYGTEEVEYPWGSQTRFKLFDQPFGSRREALIGQEEAQQTFYSILQSFVREGRPHRLILLHGPNGSSKSTFVACIGRALEHYSNTDEGALYKFSWVFPSEKAYSTTMGFMKSDVEGHARIGDFAHYEDADIDAKLPCEIKDHPLLILPVDERLRFIDEVLEKKNMSPALPELIRQGGMCPKCKLIFDALMTSYRGDLARVLNHVQVERYFISKRYGRGFASIGPQMSVDGGERQVTIDRSLSALPKVLQNISLFEPFGDLVEGSGGMVEFSDLLKRPVEAFKYLLETIETGEVQLGQSIHRVNAVLVSTSNEVHFNAFKQHPDAISFLSRTTTIKTPYILYEPVEREIYENQVVEGLGKHVAPHSIEIASSWAVMSRLFKPNSDYHDEPVRKLVKELLCTEKFDIYTEKKIPSRFSSEETKLAANNIDKLYHETDNLPVYEGIAGASPREIKAILYLAAQNSSYECLTPMAVMEEIENFIKKTKDYSFLNMEKKEGHYHDFKHFIDIVKIRLVQYLLVEVVEASDVFAEKQFDELWNRYVIHASTWVKGEKVLNPVTKKHENPDESLMDRIESLLDVKNKEVFRQDNLSRIAAAAIEKRHGKTDYSEIFSRYIETLRAGVIRENLPKFRDLVKGALKFLSEKDDAGDVTAEVKAFLEKFQGKYNYCPHCARASLGYLMAEKLAR